MVARCRAHIFNRLCKVTKYCHNECRKYFLGQWYLFQNCWLLQRTFTCLRSGTPMCMSFHKSSCFPFLFHSWWQNLFSTVIPRFYAWYISAVDYYHRYLQHAYIYLFPREIFPGLHLGGSDSSTTLSSCSPLYNDIHNAICSHGQYNNVYLPRYVCHPSVFLHVFPRNLDRVRLSLPRISPHPVCLSFELHEQHQSWFGILLFLHLFNSLPLQCCGDTQIPSQPVEEHLAELLDLQ